MADTKYAGFFTEIFRAISSLGNIFFVCCSFLLRSFLRLTGRPASYILRLLRSFTDGIKKNAVKAFRNADGRRKYFTGRLSRSLKRVFSLLPRHPLRALSVLSGYANKGTRVYAPIIRGALCVLIPAVALLTLLFTINSYRSLSASLIVKCAGETIGCVQNENVLIEARSIARSRISLAAGSLPDITYSVALVPASGFSDAAALAQTLIEKSDVDTVTACGIYIDGEFLCAVGSESAARRVFDAITSGVTAEDENDIVGFVEQISYVTGLYPKDVVWDIQKLAKTVNGNTSPLTLKTVRTVVATEKIGFSTVYIETDSLALGKERTVVDGADGVDQVTSFVTYVDGEPISSDEVSRLTVVSPVAQRIQIGTRENGEDGPSGYYGGILLWPTVGATNINSPFGYRWGRLHAGIDIGCAYGTSYGKSVVAAEEGTVVISSYNSISGYYVEISHGNGMQTYYGHMQQGSVCVNPGDRVYAGQKIGKIGATGFVTGPHLHFEVRINGSSVNPAPYIGLS